MDLGSTQPLTEMGTGVFPGGKKRPVLKASNLTTILGYCHVIWELFLEPSGHVGPVMGRIYLYILHSSIRFTFKS